VTVIRLIFEVGSTRRCAIQVPAMMHMESMIRAGMLSSPVKQSANLNDCFSNRALMSSYHCLWHIIGRVLAWVTLLLAIDICYWPILADTCCTP